MNLRPYQLACVDAVQKAFQEVKRTLVVVPTGGGKTVVFSKLAALNPGRTLILAHREELIHQAADKLRAATGIRAEIEKAESHASRSARVVIASIQSLLGDSRLGSWDPKHFGLVIVDEAHHTAANSYRKVLGRFDGHAHVLGVTATPDRADKRNLGEYFQSVAYEISLFDLINDGYLSRIQVKSVPLQIDLNKVRSTMGDFNETDLGAALEPYLGEIARAIVEHAGFRRTLAFLPLRATSRKFVEACQKAGLTACHIDGESEDRKEILARFAAGEFEVLSNAMLLTEGFDDPGIDCVVVLRPTRSRPLYCLDSNTQILTEHGWLPNVAIGTKVAALDPNDGSIRFVPATNSIRRKLEPDEYFVSIKSQSVDIRVTNKHRMLYDHKRRTGWKFKTAEDLASLKDTNYLPVSGLIGRHGVPLSDDDLRFIGWVMTDGTINRINGAITITQGEHQPWLEQIQSCIDGCGFKNTRSTKLRRTQFNQSSRCVMWTISRGKPRGSGKHLTGWGRLEKWLSKDFSPSLFDATERQFDVLLEAIHLGDGAKQTSAKGWTRRSYHISTANLTFAERLQMAAVLNGWRCNITRHENGRNGIWVIHCKKQPWSRVGGNGADRPAWVKEPHADEYCWCVENELGTLITRRNGKVAIVGNCQMVGRGTRLASHKENLLLLDFLWLHTAHSISRPAHLIAKSDDEAKVITELSQERAATWGEGELDLGTLASDAVAKREEALRKKLEQQAKKREKFISAEEFAMQHGNFALAEFEPTMEWERQAPSEKQLRYIKKAGIDPESIRGRVHASKLLDLVFKNQPLRMASESAAAKIRSMPWIAERVGITDFTNITTAQAGKFFAALREGPRGRVKSLL